jgi:hypothetical protein
MSPRNAAVARPIPEDDDDEQLEEALDTEPRAYRRRTKTVHHWAKCWLGKPEPGNSTWYAWVEEPAEIEVAVQEYGDPKWIENLFTDMIDAAKDLLAGSEPAVTAARLRVRLFSHRPDGDDARFTLEHIQKR